MKKIISLTVVLLMFISCEIKPAEVHYGSDKCDHCGMTIVDKQHASQLVTNKGKPYKYDAIECMIVAKNDKFSETEMAFELIADFDNPGTLTDANTATYLISENIKSPMGANLSGFKEKETAIKTMNEFGGKIYTWAEIQENLKNMTH
ncbi:MAG: nitrous oxide reductase accessory protein NosL [Weeksellaceae bacterium]